MIKYLAKELRQIARSKKKKTEIMGKKCVVRLCSFSQDMTSLPDGLTFHKFPSDVSQRQAWINALALPINWTPKARETICSRHFLKESFYPRKSESSKVFLKPFAIPTKFLGDSCAVMDLPTVPDSFVVPAFSVKPVPYTMDPKVELIMDTSNDVSAESNFHALTAWGPNSMFSRLKP